MNFKRLLLFLAAPLALVMSSCEPDAPIYSTPSIAITDADGAEVTALNFSAEGGAQTFTITANYGWTISKQADWLGVTPSSDTNSSMLDKSVVVEVKVGPNEGGPRTETIKITMEKIEKNIAIHQADQEGNTTGGTGEGTLESPYDVARAMNIILEGTYTEDMVYTEGIISELGEDGRAQYGSYTFSISDDGTTAGQLLVYRSKYLNGKNFTTSDNLAVGDKVIICGQLVNFKGNTPEIQSCYIAAHNGEMPDAPVLKEGVYASDAAFVCNFDNSNNAVYSLGDTNVGGNDVSGFKLGTGSKAGVFTSQAIGVSGDKYLNFYAVAWNGKTATLYYRVNGGEAMSQALVANTGANNNAPYNGLVIAATDHYSVKLTGLQATDKIEFSTNSSFSTAADDASGRAIVFGVKLTDEALEGEAGSGGNQGGTTGAPETLIEATIAEFLAASVSDNTWYKLTGEIISIEASNAFGNFTIKDATDEVYIYGMTNGWVGSNDKSFSQIGLKVGDTVTLGTLRGEYNGEPQGGGNKVPAYYISHVAGEGGEEPEPEDPEGIATVTEDTITMDFYGIKANGGSVELLVNKYGDQAHATESTWYTWNVGDYTFAGIKVCEAEGSNKEYVGGYLQQQGHASDAAKQGEIFNTAPIALKTITIVAANANATYTPSANLYVGTTERPVSGTAVTATAKDSKTEGGLTIFTWTYDLSGLNAQYFNFVNNTTGANYYKSFTITYGEGGEGGKEPEPEDPEDPEDPETPVEPTVATIASIVALGEGATVAEGTFVEGVVISNSELNNLTSKKGLYIQDETAGLQFYCGANHSFKFGDKVKVDLSGQKIAYYNGAVQISGTTLDKFEVLSSGNAVEAKTVTMADFLANKYEGQYIALEGVQVVDADLAKTWVVGGKHTSVNMEDAEGKAFVVFSSSYASYGAETVAQGSGTIKGISSINVKDGVTTMQIIFAQATDYAGLTGERFGATVEPEEPEIPVEPETLEAIDANAYYVFKQATEFAPGKWYAMVAENNAATALTSNYGYLKVVTPIALTEGISLPASCAWGIVSTEGGYTIQQYDGKYVYQTGSYNSFNVDATAPASGHVWTIKNGVITNAATSKTVQFDTHNSYGCYDSVKGAYPAFYELVEVDTNAHLLGTSVSNLSFTADGGEKTFDVTTYGEATLAATSAAEWLTVSVADGVVTVVAAANEGEARDAEVTVTFGEESMTVAVEQAAPRAEGEAAWVLVTDAATLAVGDQIVIVATGYDKALSTTQNNNNRASAAITKSGNTVVVDSTVQVITLEAGTVDNTFGFNVGTGYLYAASGSSNHLKTGTLNDNASWLVTIDGSGVATIKAQGDKARNWMRYNSQNDLFSCYASGQADIAIYKYTE